MDKCEQIIIYLERGYKAMKERWWLQNGIKPMLEDLAFTSHRELFKNIYEQKAKHIIVPIGKGKSRIDRYSP